MSLSLKRTATIICMVLLASCAREDGQSSSSTAALPGPFAGVHPDGAFLRASGIGLDSQRIAQACTGEHLSPAQAHGRVMWAAMCGHLSAAKAKYMLYDCTGVDECTQRSSPGYPIFLDNSLANPAGYHAPVMFSHFNCTQFQGHSTKLPAGYKTAGACNM